MIKKKVSEFYHWRAVCKECFDTSEKVVAKCIDCGLERTVTKTSVRNSKGRCRKCAQKLERNKPEVRKISSESARRQVLLQGGVPNAKKFTSERVSGANHHNWKGGITPPINRLRGTTVYKKWRESVISRDKGICQECGKLGNKMHAHHIKPIAIYPDLVYDVTNGKTLCNPCHGRIEMHIRYNK